MKSLAPSRARVCQWSVSLWNHVSELIDNIVSHNDDDDDDDDDDGSINCIKTEVY